MLERAKDRMIKDRTIEIYSIYRGGGGGPGGCSTALFDGKTAQNLTRIFPIQVKTIKVVFLEEQDGTVNKLLTPVKIKK